MKKLSSNVAKNVVGGFSLNFGFGDFNFDLDTSCKPTYSRGTDAEGNATCTMHVACQDKFGQYTDNSLVDLSNCN